jgi:hypothetical protein
MKRVWFGLLLLSAAAFSAIVACTGADPVLGDVVAPVEAGPPMVGDEGGSAEAAAATPEAGVDAQAAHISIAGKLITNNRAIPEYGLFVPLAGPGVSVYIGGKKVPAVGADGTFTLADVVTPYDAFVIERNASLGTYVTAYLGLTRMDPVLFGGVGQTPEFSATVTGTLTPAPAGGTFALVAVGAAGGGQATDGLSDETSTATYSMGNVRWASEVAPQVKAAAYTAIINGTTFLPTGFLNYGVTAPFVPVAGGANAIENITLNQVFTTSTHVVITPPPGFAITERVIAYQPAQGPTFRVSTTDPSATTLDFAFPSNASGEIDIRTAPANVGGFTDSVEQILRPLVMGSQTLTVPAITSRITAPADGAITAGTPIAWSTTPNAAYRLVVYPSTGVTGGSVVLTVNTTSSGAKMPDLSKLNVVLSAGTYEAHLSALSPFGSLDDVCGPTETLGFQTNTFAVGTKFTTK